MKMIIYLIIPLLGTILGSALVYILKNKNKMREEIITSFAGGIMLFASVYSLISNAIIKSNNNETILYGITLGFIIFLLIDNYLTNNKFNIFTSVSLHNIPEGITIGIIASSPTFISVSALIGLSIQNIPDGAIISIPLYENGKSKNKSFVLGVISGIIEFIFSIISLLLTKYIITIYPLVLSIASGMILYMTIYNLLQGDKSNHKSIAFLIGFILMLFFELTF